MSKRTKVSASELKAHCSQLIDEVSKKGKTVFITRRGKDVAMLVPIRKKEEKTLFGFARGLVKIHGDILEPVDVNWEAQR